MTQYRNPTPVAVALVRAMFDGNTIGLVAMRRNDNKGFAFPGGYLEEFETAEQAAARELQEETGLVVPAEKFRPVKTLTNQRNNMLVFCVADDVLITPQQLQGFVANDEAMELKVVVPGDVLVFPLHQQVLDHTHLW